MRLLGADTSKRPADSRWAIFPASTASIESHFVYPVPAFLQAKVGFLSETEEDESWFWTEEWQAGERKADEDLAEGRFTDFETVDELIAHLHAEREEKRAAEQS